MYTKQMAEENEAILDYTLSVMSKTEYENEEDKQNVKTPLWENGLS